MAALIQAARTSADPAHRTACVDALGRLSASIPDDACQRGPTEREAILSVSLSGSNVAPETVAK
eukprot:10156698-Lingulodinium_polyedra.AAC.1